MTEKDKYEELRSRYQKLAKEMKQISDEIRELKIGHIMNLPYIPSRTEHGNYETYCGYHNRKKDLWLYYNNEEKTYYKQPLFRLDGQPLGRHATKKEFFDKKEEQLIQNGFRLVD